MKSHPTHTHAGNFVEVMGKLFSLIVVTSPQCTHISKHQVVHLKYIQFVLYQEYPNKAFFLRKETSYETQVILNFLVIPIKM